MIRAILFDFDGTLVDSIWVWKKVDDIFLTRRNTPVPSDLHSAIAGKGFSETAAYFKERFRLSESEDAIKNEWLAISDELYMHDVALKPGVMNVLEYCKQHTIQCAIGSSNNRAIIDRICTAHGIRDYFKTIVTSCDVGKGKPAPDLFLEIARQLSISPDNILVVDDILEGVHAGKAAGMTTVGIYDEHYDNHDALKRESDHYIYSLEELPDIVERLLRTK